MTRVADKLLIKKFLSGSCSIEEKERVNLFLQQEEGKKMLEELMLEEWEQAASFKMEATERETLRASVIEQINYSTDTKPRQKGFFNIVPWQSAAMWLLFVMGGAMVAWFITQRSKSESPQLVQIEEQVNPLGRRSTFLLPDSTKVYLGAGSRLTYAKPFSGSSREVTLEGEAFFEVVKNMDQPFIVRSYDVKTTVLGTSFKIDALKGQPLTVSVVTGKVRVDRFRENRLEQTLGVLTAGKQVIYTRGTAPLLKEIETASLLDWTKGRLVFDARSLQSLTEELGRWYDVEFLFKKKRLMQIPVTITIDANVPLNKLMEGLQGAVGFNYKIEQNKVTLY